jgi:hypothetical protein
MKPLEGHMKRSYICTRKLASRMNIYCMYLRTDRNMYCFFVEFEAEAIVIGYVRTGLEDVQQDHRPFLSFLLEDNQVSFVLRRRRTIIILPSQGFWKKPWRNEVSLFFGNKSKLMTALHMSFGAMKRDAWSIT